MHFEIRGKCIWNEKCILIPEEMYFEFRRNGSDLQSTAVRMCKKNHWLTLWKMHSAAAGCSPNFCKHSCHRTTRLCNSSVFVCHKKSRFIFPENFDGWGDKILKRKFLIDISSWQVIDIMITTMGGWCLLQMVTWCICCSSLHQRSSFQCRGGDHSERNGDSIPILKASEWIGIWWMQHHGASRGRFGDNDADCDCGSQPSWTLKWYILMHFNWMLFLKIVYLDTL